MNEKSWGAVQDNAETLSEVPILCDPNSPNLILSAQNTWCVLNAKSFDNGSWEKTWYNDNNNKRILK